MGSTTYGRLTIYDGNPSGEAGLAINNNFKAIEDSLDDLETNSVANPLTADLDIKDKKIYTSTTNGKIVVEPNGTGAFQLDGARNLRGDNAVDLQMVGTYISHVASGDYSVISGGADNLATATGSAIPGGWEGKAEYEGGITHAAGSFATAGDAQTSVLVAHTETVGTSNNYLEIDGNPIVIPLNKTVVYFITVVARRVDGPHESAGWRLMGVAENASNVLTVLSSSSPSETKIEISNDNPGVWGIDVLADIYGPNLLIRPTGQTGKTIRWVARIELTEVQGGDYYS